MSDQTSADLERDAERARAKVADTAESIRNKMSPGQLIDEFSGLFQGSDGKTALSNLKNQIRDNPLPLSLVGAGLAWLMLGKPASEPTNAGGNIDFGRATHRDRGSPAEPTDSALGKVSDATTGAMDSASTIAGNAVEGTKRSAEQILTSVTGKAGEWKDQASEMTKGGKQTLEDLLQREPLIVAALGVAVGAAIGALLPTTDFEDEQLGDYRDKVRDTVGDVYRKGVEEVKDVAAGTYASVKAEADKTAIDDGTIVERVGSVLKSTAEQTEQAVREKLKTTTDR